MNRVVITGMGAVSPLGIGVSTLWDGLLQGRSGVVHAPVLDGIDVRPKIAGLVQGLDEKAIPRKLRRSMSPMSIYGLTAAYEALKQAGLDPAEAGEALALYMGSTTGSPVALEEFFRDYFAEQGIERIRSTHFFKVMNHSVAANVAQALGLTGRIGAGSAACATGSQAVAMGFEAIRSGYVSMALCGGAEEFHPLTVATFDKLEAASHICNETPEAASRPFDANRDGIVCSEGAGVLVLESLENARQRGATILAEVLGAGQNADPASIAHPDPHSIQRCMELALESANTHATEVDYVNAHSTGTIAGDVAECRAILELVGSNVPVGCFKGNMGHTMAASGALEVIGCVQALRTGQVPGNMNLVQPDEICGRLNLLLSSQDKILKKVLKNNFGLGGVNCSLVLGSIQE